MSVTLGPGHRIGARRPRLTGMNTLALHEAAESPSRTPVDVWALRRMLHGMHPVAVASAAGVSLRTAYRWRNDVAGLEEVAIGTHSATFVIRHDKPPMRLTPWRRKP